MLAVSDAKNYQVEVVFQKWAPSSNGDENPDRIKQCLILDKMMGLDIGAQLAQASRVPLLKLPERFLWLMEHSDPRDKIHK